MLVNPDIEFHEHGWLEPMLERTDTTGARAAVVGEPGLHVERLAQNGLSEATTGQPCQSASRGGKPKPS